MEQTIAPYLLYKDSAAALDFLSEAFGFEEVLRYTGEEGYVNHAETKLGNSVVMLGSPGPDFRNPKDIGVTVLIHVMVEDVDAHYERAKAAGAEIKDEPEDQDYGHRRYSALDPEGHHWYFAQAVKDVAPEEWGAAVSAS